VFYERIAVEPFREPPGSADSAKEIPCENQPIRRE
jgi:hypothetical protein